MDIRDLTVFLHLCDTCHFGNTAKAMHVSPSTLSRQILRLEETLGKTLFIRDNRTVQLTAEGELVQQFAQHTLQHYKQLNNALQENDQQVVGELQLFCSVTAAYSHLPPILDHFRALYPRVEIKLSTGDAADAAEMLQSHHADLAIAGRPEPLPAYLDFKKIDDIEMRFLAPIAPGPFSEALNQPTPDWHNVPFILPEHGPSRRRIDHWFKVNKITHPRIYATVSGHEAIVSMVALGCGVAILPQIVLEHSPEPIRARIQALSIQMPTFDLGICVQKKRMNERVIHAFWQSLN